jgi:hypothetical protein
MTSDSTTAREGATTLTIREQWHAVWATYEATKAIAEAVDAEYDAAWREAGGDVAASRVPAVDRLGDLAEETGQAQSKLFGQMILTPAPDIAAVLLKMVAMFGQGDTGPDDDMAPQWVLTYPQAVIADLERLQSEAATGWLDQWTKEGGSVAIDDEGHLQVAYRADSAHQAKPSGMGEEVDLQESRWQDGRYHGTMQAMYDALRMFGGAGAIKAHMRNIGARQIAPKEQGK